MLCQEAPGQNTASQSSFCGLGQVESFCAPCPVVAVPLQQCHLVVLPELLCLLFSEGHEQL